MLTPMLTKASPPTSVAVTFGVAKFNDVDFATMVDVAGSYVGAFGAQRPEDD